MEHYGALSNVKQALLSIFAPTLTHAWEQQLLLFHRRVVLHPSEENDPDIDVLFTKDNPIVFAFHGYSSLIHQLTYRRTNHHNVHVRGYKEEGSTTTPSTWRYAMTSTAFIWSKTSSTGCRVCARALLISPKSFETS